MVCAVIFLRTSLNVCTGTKLQSRPRVFLMLPQTASIHSLCPPSALLVISSGPLKPDLANSSLALSGLYLQSSPHLPSSQPGVFGTAKPSTGLRRPSRSEEHTSEL